MAYNKEMKMHEGYIYYIYNDINDKIYIGQTIYTMRKRLKDHISEAHRLQEKDNSILHRAINKYGGEHFFIEEIIKVSSPTKKELFNELNALEILYIKELNTMKPNGYNICSGGSNWGIPVKPVDLYDYEGILQNEYENATYAAEDNGITTACVLANCIGKNSKTKSGVFRFHGDSFDKYPIVFFTNKEEVDVYNTIGEYIKTASSLREAADEFNTDVSSVNGVCKGRHSHANYYVFRYKGEPFNLHQVKSFIVGKYNKENKLVNMYISPNECMEKESMSSSKMYGHLSGKISMGRDGYYYRYITNINEYNSYIIQNYNQEPERAC